MKREEQPLDRVGRVVILQDSGDSDSGPSYPVRLEGDRLKTVNIFSPSDYQEARRVAEELARFLSRPVEDFSSGVKVVREPDRLDESLRERILRTKEDTSHLPPAPFPMRTKITEMAEGLILDIPGQGITGSHWVQTGIVLIFVGFVIYFFSGFLRLPAPSFIRYLFGGFLLIFFILVPLLAALRYMHREAKHSTRVTVTPAFLRVVEHAGRRSKTREIPADELEELDLSTGKDRQNRPGPKTGSPSLICRKPASPGFRTATPWPGSWFH
jgi:hypothetical protein